jgi:L-threonylcarbamoyladenylate synthase
MDIINKDELRIKKELFKTRILRGEVFIYPTDTIYGIGCNALNEDAVKRVRNIKQRVPEKPFSIIAPSKESVERCCIINDEAKEWLEKLPGPYTLILPIKKNCTLPKNVNSDRDSIGIRIPEHWISDLVAEMNIPIITASANIKGQDYMTSLEDLDPKVKSKVDFIIYEGEKKGNPSTLVNIARVDLDFSKKREVIQKD